MCGRFISPNSLVIIPEAIALIISVSFKWFLSKISFIPFLIVSLYNVLSSIPFRAPIANFYVSITLLFETILILVFVVPPSIVI